MPNSIDSPVTKSQFKLGMNCIHKLRHARNQLPQKSHDDELVSLLTEGGAFVEALARAAEPGELIGGFGDEAIAKSRDALLRGTQRAAEGRCSTLYEVTIRDGDFLARLDLVRMRPSGIDLVEIKSKSVNTTAGEVQTREFFTKEGTVKSEWIEHSWDLAYQHEVLLRWLAAHLPQNIPPTIIRVTPKMMLIDKSGIATSANFLSTCNYKVAYERGPHGVRATVRYEGGVADRGILVEHDMSEVVRAMKTDAQAQPPLESKGLSKCMASIRDYVHSDHWPDVKYSLGPHCKKCEFRVKDCSDSGFLRCWGSETQQVSHHVLSLHRLKDKQCQSAIQSTGRCAQVSDIAKSLHTPSQAMQFEAVRCKRPIVRKAFASAPQVDMKVAETTGAVYFVDFETFTFPIPSWVGGRPSQHVPFQFEGHRLPNHDAPLDQRERLSGFLELADNDPRRAFVDALQKQFGNSGPIFHWHCFERTVLNAIRADLMRAGLPGDTDRVAFIDTLVGGRLVNLLKIAEGAFYHPDMQGSFSIKRVLPIAWAEPSIRRHFVPGHGAAGDPDAYNGDTDPYLELPPPPGELLQVLGRAQLAQQLTTDEDSAESDGSAIRNGGMAMRAYHYARMFNAPHQPEIVNQLRQYCRLDSAAMVMVYALMRDIVPRWLQYDPCKT